MRRLSAISRATRAVPPVLLAAWPGAAQAQGLSCSFDLVCAPQIGCEPHEGVPFALEATEDGGFGFARNGVRFDATPAPRAEGGPLTLIFAQDVGTLLFSLSASGSAVLTEHRETNAGRVTHSSFSGTCEVM